MDLSPLLAALPRMVLALSLGTAAAVASGSSPTVAGSSTPAAPDAADLERAMQLWCTQEGEWRGQIDITAPDGKMQTAELVTLHYCDPGATLHVVREHFVGSLHTVKVTYIDYAAKLFRVAYFAGGKEAAHEYLAVDARGSDDDHWRTVIEGGRTDATYEGRAARVRYVRERRGDVIESWKEVQFSGQPQFEARSRIVQKRVVASGDVQPAS